MSQNILITGAGGFLGGAVARHLLEKNRVAAERLILHQRHEKPLISDHLNYCVGRGSILVACDLSDKKSLSQIMADYRPATIIHCAGLKPVAAETRKQSDFDRENLRNGETLVTLAKTYGAKKFIFASSVSVYGRPKDDSGIIQETDPAQPKSDYARSKYEFEKILLKQEQIKSVILRIANVAGQDAFIPHAVRIALSEKTDQTITQYGAKGLVRDFIHIDDVAEIFSLALNYLDEKNETTLWNAGSGVGFFFADITAEIEKQTKAKIPIIRQNFDSTKQIEKVICDIKRIKSATGFSAQNTNLQSIVAYTIERIKKEKEA